jgi:hypothetical protein
LEAAKTDADRLKIEEDYYAKIKEAKTKNINDQAKLDKSLAKTAKERDTIEKNRLTALKQLDTETINENKRTTEAENKIKLDGLNENVRIAQEKLKNSENDFQLRIALQDAQNKVELEQLTQQGKDTTDVVKRQAKELNDLRIQLASKQQADEIKLGDIQQETEITKQIIALKQNEGETLVEFAKRRADLEKKLRDDKARGDIKDIDARLSKEVEIEENGVKKKVKAVKEGSEEEALLIKQKNDIERQLSDETLANDLANQEKKKQAQIELVEKTLELANQLADAANAILEAQTARIEAEYDKRLKAKEKENADELENQELTDAQRIELERQQAEELAVIEEEKQAKLKEIQKKQADIEFAITVANIIAQTALGVAKVTGQTGVGAALAIPLVLASGAIQLATAFAQRQAVQALARGGMVYGAGGPEDDMVPAMLSNGESVMTAEATRRYAPLLSALNESVGGNPIKPNFYAAGGIVTANPGQVTVSNIGDLAAVAGQSAVRAYILQSEVESETVRNARIVRDSRIK